MKEGQSWRAACTTAVDSLLSSGIQRHANEAHWCIPEKQAFRAMKHSVSSKHPANANGK